MSEIWARLIEWADALTKSEAAILGAIATAALAGFGKYIFLPVSSWFLKKIGQLLYPITSGAFLLDRMWALPQYLKNVDDSCGRLRNPWLEEGQRLTEIFVPVSATAGGPDSQRVDLRQVFGRNQRTVMIGDPGSGKSTGLRAIALDCINGRIRPSQKTLYVPVFIELRHFAEAKVSLEEYLVEVFRENGFPNPHPMIVRLRREGQLAFLLDALDEVEEMHRADVLKELRSLFMDIKNRTGNRVILTSRPMGYDDQLRDLVEETYQMADFLPNDMRQFIRNWHFRPPKSQEMLLKVLAERPQILEICRNPLMLTIVTSLYKETDYQLPDSREEFFRICVDALLRRWDEARELDKRNKHPPGLKEAFLQELSFRVLKEGFKPLSASSLLEDVEVFLKGRHRDSKEAEAFLNEIIRSGLLGHLPTNEVYFAHKTFAESLASFFLRSRPKELASLWSKSPNAWLEVCSLFVSDFRCQPEDTDLFLSDAVARKDWSGLLTLAGEAHFCPDKYRKLIHSRLQTDRELWNSLNRRAISSIARLGSEARDTLTGMLNEGTPEVQKLTIYALGLSREPWALDLVVSALTGESKATAIVALASLGEPVVLILNDLIRLKHQNEDLMQACIGTLSAVGSPAAIANVLPLIWSKSSIIRTEATIAVVNHLDDPEHARIIEGEVSGVEVSQFEEVQSLIAWAVPYLKGKPEALRATYCRLIKTSIGVVDQIESPRILIPSLIEGGYRGIYSKTIHNRYEFRTRPEKLWEIATETLAGFSPNKARQAWSRAFLPIRSDIKLSGDGPLITYLLASLIVTLLPFVWHIYNGGSLLLLIPFVFVLINAIILAVYEKKGGLFWGGLMFHGVGLLGARIFYQEFWSSDDDILRIISVSISVTTIILLGTAGVILLSLGTLWVLALVPLLASGFFKIKDDSVILVQRSDLMRRLFDRLEATNP